MLGFGQGGGQNGNTSYARALFGVYAFLHHVHVCMYTVCTHTCALYAYATMRSMMYMAMARLSEEQACAHIYVHYGSS